MQHNYCISVLLACIIQTTAYTQPTIKTQRVAGGSSGDYLTSMWLTKDGGLIAGGYSSSNISGEKTESNRGYEESNDYWIVKYNSLHNIEWDKTIGGDNDDGLYSVQQTTDGGYILGGWSNSNISGEKTETSRGAADYWIVKLDLLGNIQWDKSMGGDDDDKLYSLQQTSDGGYILGGYSLSNISGEKTENSRGDADYWVVKLDSLGNIEWDKTIGGESSDGLNSLQPTSDGGYILGGASSSNISGEKTENNRGGILTSDYWLVKLNSLGKIQWDKTIGGVYHDHLSSIHQTTDGGYILGGYSASNKSGEKTENSRGSDDYWIVKLDSTGSIQWDKTIGGNSYDDLTSLQQTSDGGYILGGYSASNISGEKTETSRGGFDYWVIKLNSQARIQWDKTIGGNYNDGVYSIKEIEKNRYILGGYSLSSNNGDKRRLSRGDSDYWIVGLFNKTGNHAVVNNTSQNISSFAIPNTNKSKGFSVYPVPAKDVLHVEVSGKATLSLTDQSGKILLTKIINGSGEINIAALPAGLYYLKNIATGVVQKVIIVK